MRLFAYHEPRGERIGVQHGRPELPDALDLTEAWRRYAEAERLTVPSRPTLPELFARGLLSAESLDACLDWLAQQDLTNEPDPSAPASDGRSSLIVSSDARPALPVRPRQILCVAKNYAAHASEMGGTPSPEPVFFAKLPSTLLVEGAPLSMPPGRTDFEGEVALIIGRDTERIDRASAWDAVAGITVVNDVTQRDDQSAAKAGGQPWLRAKNRRGFCPIASSVLLPRDQSNWSATRIRTSSISASGETSVHQEAPLSDMVHDIPTLLASVSEMVSLFAGDLILTGTPAGVGPMQPGERTRIELLSPDGSATLIGFDTPTLSAELVT